MADAAGPVFQYFWCKERTRIPPTLISPSRWAFGGRLWLGCADFALCDSWLVDQEVRHRFALFTALSPTEIPIEEALVVRLLGLCQLAPLSG